MTRGSIEFMNESMASNTFDVTAFPATVLPLPNPCYNVRNIT